MPIEALWLTIQLAFLTTTALLLAGAPFAWWLARARTPWRPFIEAALSLPLVLPPTVLGFYLLIMMGDSGPFGGLWQALFHRPLAFSFWGLWVAALVFSLPFALQPMLAGFTRIDAELLEAAETLGANGWQSFLYIAVPLGASGLAAAAALTFAHTLGEFGVVLMVGGNIPGETQTLSMVMYDRVEALRFDEIHPVAGTLLLLSYALLLALAWARWRSGDRETRFTVLDGGGDRRAL